MSGSIHIRGRENWRILREIDEYLRVLSCWDSAVFVSAKYRPTRASVEYAGRDTDLGHLIVEACEEVGIKLE